MKERILERRNKDEEMPERKLIFCYATLADDKYLKALLGEIPQEKFEAVLRGYEIGIQKFEDMPPLVQKIILENWKPEEFMSYFARKSKNNTNIIKGIALLINKSQEKILDDWEFNGLWFTREEVVIEDLMGNKHSAFTYVIKNGKGEKVSPTDILNNPYPINEKKMIEIAEKNNLAAREEKREK